MKKGKWKAQGNQNREPPRGAREHVRLWTARFPSWGPRRTDTVETGTGHGRPHSGRRRQTLEAGCGAGERDLLLAPHRNSRAALFRPSGRHPGPQPLSAGSWKERLQDPPGTLSGKSPRGPRPSTVLPAASGQQMLAALGCLILI